VSENPYTLTLLLASKQAAFLLSEIGKALGKQPHEQLPLMQLTRALHDFEEWERTQK
jgi:hypothetical protein